MTASVLALALDFPRLGRRVTIASTARRIAIVGPSGAGKTTVLRAIAGIGTDAVGTVAVGGDTWQDSAAGVWVPAWARGVGWVPQDARLFPHLRVADNLRFSPRGTDDAAGIVDALELGALLGRMPRALSGGERQRVALGRALLSSPRLLLLDEPFAALHAELRVRLRAWLAELCAARDLPLVLASHDGDDVAQLADDIHTLG